MSRRPSLLGSFLFVVACAMPLTAVAGDPLRLATGGKGDWDASLASLGTKVGIFRDAGIDLEVSYADGGGQALDAVIAGSADVVLGLSVITFIGAATKGAPIKMIAGNFVGASDALWYARADSKIESLKDFTTDTTVAYAANGAFSHIAALALLDQAGVKAKPVAGGPRSAVMIMIMSGQIDVGFDGNGGLGVPEFQNNLVKVVALGEEVEAFRGQTVRGIATSTAFLSEHRDVLVRFLQAYQKTIDWAYEGRDAFRMYAADRSIPVEEVVRLIPKLYLKSAFGVAPVKGIERSVEQGLRFKRIARQPTADELANMFDMIWTPGKLE